MLFIFPAGIWCPIDSISESHFSTSISAQHILYANVILALKIPFAFPARSCFDSSLCFWGSILVGSFLKKHLEFLLWHIHFHVLVSAPSQLTLHQITWKLGFKLKASINPHQRWQSGRFTHVKPPGWRLLPGTTGGGFYCIFANWIMMGDGMNIDQISKLNFPISRLWCKLTHRLS